VGAALFGGGAVLALVLDLGLGGAGLVGVGGSLLLALLELALGATPSEPKS